MVAPTRCVVILALFSSQQLILSADRTVSLAVFMPVFVCEACNETLKRAKVQAHAASCRGCWVLSCMDCNKKFEGDDYWDHTTCVTEAERYQGHLYVHKDNKGDVKQQAWLSSVMAKLDTAAGDSRLKPFMTALMKYDNIPRKKAKFINFAKNSLNLKADREGVAEKLWDLIGLETAPAPAASTPVVDPTPETKAATSSEEEPVLKAKENEKKSDLPKAAKEVKSKKRAKQSTEPSREGAPAAVEEETGKLTGRKRKVELAQGELKPIKWKKIITKVRYVCSSVWRSGPPSFVV